jgi:hypothetical protein
MLNATKKKKPAAKKAPVKKPQPKKAAPKKAVPKKPAPKKAAPRRRAMAPAVQPFTGMVILDRAAKIAKLQLPSGSLPILTTASDCDPAGRFAAFRRFSPDDGNTITVQGSSGNCDGSDVIFSAN